MTPSETIKLIKEECSTAKINWCLYGPALLCAVGYGQFPENLNKITVLTQGVFKGKAENTEYINTPSLKTVEIETKEGLFPAPENYIEYLNEEYGDWQNGLFDEIGCGLSSEEKKALKEHQALCKEALEFVEKTAQKCNLEYYLLAGSVLGAVRHKGFIPWDDDIDIGVPVESLEKFEKAIKENLPEKFTLKEWGANNPYPRMFCKICFEGRCCIDIWPLVHTFKKGLRARLTWVGARLLTKAHYIHIGYPVPQYYKLAKFFTLFLNDKTVVKLAKYNRDKYTNKKGANCLVNLYSIYSQQKETLDKAWFETKNRLDFEGINVPVVGETEKYLKHMYGNYLELPQPWNRASRHFERF